MIFKNSGFLSVEEFAAVRKVSPQCIRRAIAEGRCDAYIVGKQYCIRINSDWQPRRYIGTRPVKKKKSHKGNGKV